MHDDLGRLPGPAVEVAEIAELHSAIAQMWGIANFIDVSGTEIQFTFHSRGGALTMLGWARTNTQGGRYVYTSFRSFSDSVEPVFTSLLRREGINIRVTLQLSQTGWFLVSVTQIPTPEAPPEAKTLPVNQLGFSEDAIASSHTAAREMVRLLAPGIVESAMKIELEDDRIVRWQPLHSMPRAGEEAHLGPSLFEEEIGNALLPFTRGVGGRTLTLLLRLNRRAGEEPARWRALAATTLSRAAMSPDPVLTAYRRIHERILRQWREDRERVFDAVAGLELTLLRHGGAS